MEDPLFISYDEIINEYATVFRILAIYSLFWGVQFTLFLASISALARRSSRKYVLYFFTTFLFLDSTIWVALSLQLGISAARVPVYPTSLDILNSIAAPLLLLSRMNHVLSDVVVVWRAWILWPSNKAVKVALIVSVVSTIAGNFSEFAYSYSKYKAAAYTAHFPVERDNYIRVFLFILPVVWTNILVTVLIAFKVREYRIEIKSYLGRTTKTRVERFLVLLVESGCVYSAIWLAYFAISLADSSGLIPASDLPGFGSWDIWAVFAAVMPMTAGVYPTIVIIISTVQSSPTIYIPTAEMGLTVLSAKTHTTSPSSARPSNSHRRTSVHYPENIEADALESVEMISMDNRKPHASLRPRTSETFGNP
ncbi:hypothetical protein EV121DRAFT_293222 [Schizophyllum commune]